MLGQCSMCCYVTNPSRGGGERFVNKVTDEQYKVVAYSIFPCLAFVVVAVITFMSRSSIPLLSNPPASRIQRDRSTAGDIQLWWLISAWLWRSVVVVVVVLVVTHPLSRPIIVLCLLTLELLWHHTVYWLAGWSRILFSLRSSTLLNFLLLSLLMGDYLLLSRAWPADR